MLKITLFYLLRHVHRFKSLSKLFTLVFFRINYSTFYTAVFHTYTDCSLTLFQLKDLAEKLPPGVYDAENVRPAYLPNGIEPNGIRHPDSNGEQHSRAESISASSLASMGLESALLNRTAGNSPGTYGTNPHQQIRSPVSSNGANNYPDVKLPNRGGAIQASSGNVSDTADGRDSGNFHNGDSGLKLRSVAPAADSNQVEAEWIEQYEPGVYITLVALSDGTRDLKRVRFR